MKSLLLVLSILFVSGSLRAECVHEVQLLGSEISRQNNPSHWVKIDGRFFKASTQRLVPTQRYTVQWSPVTARSRADIEYYTVARMSEYLSELKPYIEAAGYRLEVIGKSVQGRDLFAIFPNELSKKKTIVMMGRQHGNESTANWIIEGFLDRLFKGTERELLGQFQLVVYPMVNPDGAKAVTRYNSNGYDLNREWGNSPSEEKDEVVTVHQHFRSLKVPANEINYALDMHGSFWGGSNPDFIYHVNSSFVNQAFYNQQLDFINTLAEYDQWNGVSRISNGHPKMLRIILVKQGVNALTHETPRTIPLSSGRTVETLKSQGVALIETIMELQALRSDSIS